MNALQIEGVVAPKNPIVGNLSCWACADSGQTAVASAAPHSNAKTFRRRKSFVGAVKSIGALTRFRSLSQAASFRRPSGADLPARGIRKSRLPSPDHLRASTDALRYPEAERVRGVLVDDKFVLLLQLDWEIGRRCSTQNFVHEFRRALKHNPEVRSIGHQTAGLSIVSKCMHGRQLHARRRSIDGNLVGGH